MREECIFRIIISYCPLVVIMHEERSGRSPNIVWITLESVRSDHTSMHGYQRDTTPQLQRIAKTEKGETFDHCISHGIFTAPSSASILTGTHVASHGIGIGINETLPKELDTVPSLLSAGGYHTLGINSNSQLGPGRGLDRGFDEYIFFSPRTILQKFGPRPILKYLLNIRSRGGGFSLAKSAHNVSYMMTEVMKQKADSYVGSQRPFFLYAHYPDSHHPYVPPRPYLQEIAAETSYSPVEAMQLSRDMHDNLHKYIAEGCEFSDEEWEVLKSMYDGEIEHIDQCIGELFDYIQSLPTNRETIFIITSDHGELFGEHGLISHKIAVSDELIHVPMVAYGLPDISHQSDRLIQHIDIVKTLLDYTGVDSSQLQGIDLRSETREFSISMRGGNDARKHFERIRYHNPNFDTSKFHQETVTALRTKEFKYLRSADRSDLFDLSNEYIDVSNTHTEVVAELDEKLHEWEEKYGSAIAHSEGTLPQETLDHLQEMGYITD